MNINIKNIICKTSSVLILLLMMGSNVFSQTTEDTLITTQPDVTINKTITTPNVGGVFISPNLGFSFPLQSFAENSKSGFSLGARLEFASTKIYPFVIAGTFDYTTYPGGEEFKSTNFLNSANTTITSFGGGIDIILTKFIKTDFTIPILGLEAKMMNISRKIDPESNNPGLPLNESILAYGGSLGFTLFVFDIVTGYTYAKDYSSINVKFRFHFPVAKF
ncbi:MAG TPA: hypothetical protein DIS94_01320 [Bacteroidetes bacterium]|nr:hypothetical protein [Bacteroidota bacterium]